jgi:hypothetical protein
MMKFILRMKFQKSYDNLWKGARILQSRKEKLIKNTIPQKNSKRCMTNCPTLINETQSQQRSSN